MVNLLSEVLGYKIDYVEGVNFSNYLLYAPSEITALLYINIYELSHKCKEWAGKQGYQIKETYGFGMCFIEIGKHGHGFNDQFWRYDRPNIEPRDVFVYCQWILENKEQ